MPTAVKSQSLKCYRSRRWRRSVTQTRNYDQDYAVQSIGGLNYTVDTQGNIKTIIDAAGGNGFDYDNLDRLTKVKNSATLANVTTLTYDKTGNRLSKTVGALASATYSYPTTNHRLTSVAGVARTFDANGNTTQSAAAKFFTYDARNRLVDFRTGTTAATIVSQYQFNAKGERVRKYKGTTDQSRYLYNEGGQLLIQNKVVNGVTTTQEMIWLDDMPIGVSQNGVLNGILTDHLNTPRQIFSLATQQTQWRWNAVDDAFGEKLAVNTGMEFDLRFSGQLFDGESGLHYNYWRDGYDPQTGRYAQSDPIGLRGGISTYNYVGGSPVKNIDPTGLVTWSGTVTAYVRSYGEPVGGAIGAFTFNLTSQCLRGYKYQILVLASGVGLDAGKLPVGLTTSNVTMDDQIPANQLASFTAGELDRLPYNFNQGTFVTAGAGAVFGAGPSITGYQMGDMLRPIVAFGDENTRGIEFGASALFGNHRLGTRPKKIKCENCGNK
jgi:RHS repeat-associated protein